MIQKYFEDILALYPSWRKVRYLNRFLTTETGITITPTRDDGYCLKFEGRLSIVYREDQYIVEIIRLDKLTPSGKLRRAKEPVDHEVIFYHLDGD